MTVDTIVYEQDKDLTTIALMGAGKLEEIEIIDNSKAAEGNIYLGKITHKLDLANGRKGYLVDIKDEKDAFFNADEYGMGDVDYTEGQSIVVQVSQERRAEKGAKVVRSLQFVGTYLVYCPFRMNIDASSRIGSFDRIKELKALVQDNEVGQEGWIIRTAAMDASSEEIKEEMVELRKAYDIVRAKARSESAPCLLYAKSSPLFEYMTNNAMSLNKVVVNTRKMEEEIKNEFDGDFEVEVVADAVKSYGIDEAVVEALQKEVKLKSGGRIYIEETKAFVAIDVDTGDDRGTGSISHVNEEAAIEIAHQIRLRNLSGKIIIDFAGSSEYRYMKPVLEVLDKELMKDNTRCHVVGLSRGGNVELIRVRRRPSLSDIMSVECPTCHGTGRVEK